MRSSTVFLAIPEHHGSRLRPVEMRKNCGCRLPTVVPASTSHQATGQESGYQALKRAWSITMAVINALNSAGPLKEGRASRFPSRIEVKRSIWKSRVEPEYDPNCHRGRCRI